MCNGYLDFAHIAERYGKSAEDIKKLTKFTSGIFDEFIVD